MGLLDLLGFGGKSESVRAFMANGAIIIDVRTSGEFREGHIKGSKNIPLDQIETQLSAIQKLSKPVIVCCRSGMRSAQAASILKSNSIEVINGEGWQSLERQL